MSGRQAIIGAIVKEYVRCGRSECKCAHSDYRHGPYYYLRWREWDREAERWKQRKRYIPKGDLKREQARLRQARRRRRLRRQEERRAKARERAREKRERYTWYLTIGTYRLCKHVDAILRRADREATWISPQEFSERTGLTIPELVELNQIRLLCPQRGWNPDGERAGTWQYRPGLIPWGQKLRKRHEAGESWGELKKWTRHRWD